MADNSESPERLFLSRWSRRKHEAARAAAAASEASPPKVAAAPVATPSVIAATPIPAPGPVPAELPLPSVESLTIDSDFSAFLQPNVAADVKRAAMQKLFADPRFNVMDGLDVYIDDYTKADPMPPGMLDKLKDVYRTLTEDEVPAVADVDAQPAADVVASTSDAPATAAHAADPEVASAPVPPVASRA